jgi:methyl-accepting chemotaxis protein
VNIKNMKIGARLSAGFGLVLLLMVSLIATAYLRLSNINDITTDMVDRDWVKASAIGMINATTKANASLSMELFIAPDKAYMDSLIQKISVNKQAIDDGVATLDKLIYLPEGKALLAQFKEKRALYVGSFHKVSKLMSEDNRDEASKTMLGETLPALGALQENLQQLAALQNKIIISGGEQVKDSIASSRNMMSCLGLIAILIGVACAYAINRSIAHPIRDAVRIAQTVAAGNLTSRIEVNSTDEPGQLLQALKDMNGSLTSIVAQVRSGADTISTASGQIATGNLDLSSRTEEQASSLEETASSMEELTSTVKQNADNARQANGLTLAASEIAVKGGAVMSQVVATMGSINESANKIVDIIGVIDGIAFQTNILALNAAVEAARAGEQGRGFAVVATEVRNLAQRSASAAKEIKLLINDSVQKVDVGSKLVDQAGVTIQEVVASVKRVTDIMSDITAAGSEQTTGIEQINQAVMQMDDVTQQNAALVEQAAAAAQSLQDQAANLVQVVSVFRLDESQVAKPIIAATQRAEQRNIASSPKTMQPKLANNRGQGNLAPAKRQAATQASANDDWEEF